jgi:hypothetical protein
MPARWIVGRANRDDAKFGSQSCCSQRSNPIPVPQETAVKAFFKTLEVQRWDDHRYYHQSRINQTLHLVSALTFITSYIVVFKDPATAALLAWGISMTTRQSGHFFFEPRGYDNVNHATHEHKEEIKIGYNLQRKVVLMSLWAAIPLVFWLAPSVGGFIEPANTLGGYLHHVGMAWLLLGVGGVLFRTIHLFFLYDIQTGVCWATKILTDPFHDAILYSKAPFYLLKGQLIDPMDHVDHGHPAAHDSEDDEEGLQPAEGPL